MMGDSKTSKLVLDWYDALYSRYVDLVGDYAGSELFVIEGDSLLQHCFSQSELDFKDGFQLLHAVYLVETFLQGLVQRKCVFHITFFHRHASLCLPPMSESDNDYKYRFARSATIRHLQVNIPKVHPGVQVRVFDSLDDEPFARYLDQIGAYFIMCHDGAEAVVRKRPNIPPSTGILKQSFRAIIASFMGSGYNVALINGIKLQDSKVWTMVLEKTMRNKQNIRLSQSVYDECIPQSTPPAPMSFDVAPLALAEVEDIEVESQIVTVQALSHLLTHGVIDTSFAHAVLIHKALIENVPLSVRRLTNPTNLSSRCLAHLKSYCDVATLIVQKLPPRPLSECSDQRCDLADFIDGRVLSSVMREMRDTLDLADLSEDVTRTFKIMCNALKVRATGTLSGDFTKTHDNIESVESRDASAALPQMILLPFSDPVFDNHLESVRVCVDQKAAVERETEVDKIFKELTHWHNRQPLETKSTKHIQDAWQRSRILRRNQFFMKEMITYAASLTNSTGKILEPESIFVHGKDKKVLAEKRQSSKSAIQKFGNRNLDKKTQALSSRKADMMDNIATINRNKEKRNEDMAFEAWRYQLCQMDKESDLVNRYRKTRAYLAELKLGTGDVLRIEIQLYMLDALLRLWASSCKMRSKADNMNVAALLWSGIQQISSFPSGVTATAIAHLKIMCKNLGFPEPAIVPQSPDRKISFTLYSDFDIPLAVTDDFKAFQLEHCGPYMDRSMDSMPDTRTKFSPDRWQREVLDAIDGDKSLFVVAPTSAGKTFISFYAMKRILRADDEGVVVYVAPTKALVNQIAAEIQANFHKRYETTKSVWALHTRDYRVNSPTDCQVLVTVPHVLQIMLLSPSNAQSWSPKVRRIIFDEIHSIGQAEDGVVWEQLLLLAPCPIIALSATVGNPDEFSQWLESTQRSLNNELVVVQHAHRYSDLRKHIFLEPDSYKFSGMPEVQFFGEMGIEKASHSFRVMHPVASLVNRSRGIPKDLQLEPRECLSLWTCLNKLQNDQFPLDPALAPPSFFKDIVRKKDVYKWDETLKQVLSKWIKDPRSPFDKVVKELATGVSQETSQTSEPTGSTAHDATSPSSLVKNALPLLTALHSRGALPCIIFNYDRGLCEKIGNRLYDQLFEAESSFKASDLSWKRKMDKWEQWKKFSSRKSKSSATGLKASSANREESEKVSRAERMKDETDVDADPMASFNPDTPLEKYSFANHRVLQASELQENIDKLTDRNVPSWLCDALSRGIGIHHAGMPRAYRQAVEMLFRKGFLRVVIATGTLALGINMPCKTVVFSGDSVYLTALNFRQAAGRAGRRGFDLLGNVVFHCLPIEKVCRLMSSRLPSLNGHFPITTSLVLRLFILLHDSNHSPYAVRAINALLSQSRLFLGGQSFKEQVLHHLRFSIEYLRRSRLLSVKGAPLNFAGCVSHLYFTENASFALHALLKNGYFHELTADMNENNEGDKLRTMMLVLAHIFGRKPLRQADVEPLNIERRIKPSSSVVILPEIPGNARDVLLKHNKDTLQIFAAYVRTFAEQHLESEDNELPFTKTIFGGKAATADYDHILKPAPPTVVRSHFVALSGHGDHFDTISSLCRTARSGVFLEESVIPHIALYPNETSTPLNAYLYDFYKHGDTKALERANGIRKGDMWFLLNDFSLVLATIVTALKNLMNLKEDADIDFVDLQGDGDLVQDEAEDKWAELEEAKTANDEVKKPQFGKTAESKPKKKKQAVIESWEDEENTDSQDSSDESDQISSKARSSNKQHSSGATTPTSTQFSASSIESDRQSLLKVLKAFERLRVTFDEKFRAMWA